MEGQLMNVHAPQHLLRDLNTLVDQWKAIGAVFHGPHSPPRLLPPHFRFHVTMKFNYQGRECEVLLDQFGTVTLKAWLDDDGTSNLKTVSRPASLMLPAGFHDPQTFAQPSLVNYETDWQDRKHQAYSSPLLPEQRQCALQDVRRRKVMLQRQLDLLMAVEQGHLEALEEADSSDIFDLLDSHPEV